MFDSLTQRLTTSLQKIAGRGQLTEKNMQEGLREIRQALLEADVALPVVTAFLNNVAHKALGQKVITSIDPGQALVKLVHDELVTLMGNANEALNFKTQPPAVILIAGLQGSGKTTTTAKLANRLQTRDKKSVMVTSVDVYRPAAIAQLQTLAEQCNLHYFPSDTSQKPADIAKDAIKQAKKQFIDVLIIDTAGRLHIDDAMMSEIKHLHNIVDPIEVLFVVDSMTGQDAANTAQAFNAALPLTGVVLTKTDSDARGGAALSIRQITGKPIKFIGVGEKIDDIEVFHPERVASRILGMGDILTLVEDAERNLDKKKAEKLAEKVKKGKAFTLDDFLEQLDQMQNMGGMSALLTKLPGMGQIPPHLLQQVDDKKMLHTKAIIQSMTPMERRFPDTINGSRKRRIARGSGMQAPDINRLLKQFAQMKKMMGKFKGDKMASMMQKMSGMLPPNKNN